ncbi:MAG: hypothetical protein JF616_07710 [Fibrobacteres bacterium]|nr:hypothetical protein [Fibrobacterota bacterium]
MSSAFASSRGLFLAFFALGFLVLACHLGQETTEENSLSFSKRFDTLSTFDSLVIEVKDASGKSLGVIYKGKPAAPGDLNKLIVPGWDGGPIDIFISGYMNGQVGPVFAEKKSYNGITNKTDSTEVLIFLHPTLSTGAAFNIQVGVGERVPLPQVQVHPATLTEPGIRWASENTAIAAVDGSQLVGISDGSTRLTVSLDKDSTQKIVFTVRVGSGSVPPTRLILDRDTLHLAVNGAPARFTVAIEPFQADPDLVWRLADSTLATQRTDGAFVGTARGTTKVWVASKAKPEIMDSGWIVVSEPQPVTSVRFLRDSLTLFLGGAPESLQVEVLPVLANPEVQFTLSDSAKASLAGRLLSPKAAGNLTVTVFSVEDVTKSAVLKVTVKEPVRVEKVIADDSDVTLYLGGPGRTLAAKVLPADVPQGVRWKSLSPTVVSVDVQTGAIAPLLAGFARIVAMSAADSTQRDTVSVSVKVDAPRLTITGDSVVSAGANAVFHVKAAQEFGQIVLFQWDADGNSVWEDSLSGPWPGVSVDLPPVTAKYDKSGPVTARFRVRDSEGNVTTGSFSVRVVGGSTVSIDSPKDNSYSNQKHIPVVWSVNGITQDSLKSQDLVVGPNVISRSARDSAGKVFTATITVTLDTVPPAKPALSGTSPTNVKPKWSWTSGGGGGSGEYRFRLADAIFPADAATTRDSNYTLATDPVSGTTYTLYVEERDLAGNWSVPNSLPIRYDVTAPVVTITSPQASGIYYASTASVILSGSASGPVAISQVNYKVGTGTAAKATFTAGNWSTAAIPLAEGSSVQVTVTAVDQAGNTGEAVLNVLMDATPPAAPVLTTGPTEINVVKADFAWTAGSDGLAGSGLNGHYRYSLNGGAWKDTTAALLTNLPLIEGANVFAVQEQDRASLWSVSATRSVRVDTIGPIITLTSHTSPVNTSSTTITLSGQVKDTGTAVAAMTVSGQQAGSGTITITAGTWTTAALTLKSGANPLLITATDRVGNVHTLSVAVNVNVPAPSVVITNPGDNLTITTAGTFTVTYTVAGGAAQTKTFTLVEGANRLIVSSLPSDNPSGNIGSDTVTVTKDATQPNPPNLTATASPTNGTATWSWTSGGDNTGGAGMRTPAQFRYSLDNATTWVSTTALSYSTTTQGSYTLIVQEQDKAGNWSPSSTAKTIVVDKTAPSVTISGLRNNYVTNKASVPFSYSVDNGAAKDTTCNLTNANGANTCSAKSTDAAGNVGTASVTVYRWSKAVFVTVGGALNGTGVDWENAMSSDGFAAAAVNAAYAGSEFWMGKGSYNVNLQIHNNVSLYGGFDATKTPFDKTNRDNISTRITDYFFAGPSDATALNITLDGMVMEVLGSENINLTLNNVTVDSKETSWSYGMEMLESNITANNLVITGRTYGSSVIDFTGTFKMVGGSITNNSSAYADLSIGGAMTLSSGAVISGNFSNSDYPRQANISQTGSLTIGSGVNFSCATDVININGGTCH